MKIIFFGTPPFSAYILEKLNHNLDVVAVVCPPDKESGRGRKITASAVKQKAKDLGIKIFQPRSLEDTAFINKITDIEADLFIIVAFRLLPEGVWQIPKKGCVNLHTSFLPDYRGAAPINWVIINGENHTGISTFFINNKIDEGNIIMQEKIELDKKITAAQLHNIMMKKGVNLLLKSIQNIEKGNITSTAQRATATDKKAPKIERDLLKINWDKSAKEIHNLVRGLSPCIDKNLLLKDVAICPSAWFFLLVEDNKKIRVKLLLSDFEIIKNTYEIGHIISDNRSHLKIAVKDGCLSILKLQMEGKKALDIRSFLAGFQIKNTFRVC
ncbi:MAG: methionyl-tRNA formyltransferase [Bacteroidota bacterium]|nr:methionyl-tRNA formyltransferase [Bacteroidota bacterium]